MLFVGGVDTINDEDLFKMNLFLFRFSVKLVDTYRYT